MIKINNLEFVISRKEQVDALNNGEVVVICDSSNEAWSVYMEFAKEYLSKFAEFRNLPNDLIKFEKQNRDKMKYFRPVIEISCKNGTIRYMFNILKEFEVLDNPKSVIDPRVFYLTNDSPQKDSDMEKPINERLIKLVFGLGDPSMVSLKEKNEDSKIILEMQNQFEHGIPVLTKYVYRFIEDKPL